MCSSDLRKKNSHENVSIELQIDRRMCAPLVTLEMHGRVNSLILASLHSPDSHFSTEMPDFSSLRCSGVRILTVDLLYGFKYDKFIIQCSI